VIIVAGIGIFINSATAFLFFRRRKQDLNVRGAFVHMAADAAVSLGVVLAALAMLYTGRLWLDPAIGMVIAGLIVWSAWGLFKDSLAMSLGAAPATIEPAAVRRYLESLAGVARVHDLHIWSVGTRDVAANLQSGNAGGCPGDSFLAKTAADLAVRFGIGHPTLQIETSENPVCGLATGRGRLTSGYRWPRSVLRDFSRPPVRGPAGLWLHREAGHAPLRVAVLQSFDLGLRRRVKCVPEKGPGEEMRAA